MPANLSARALLWIGVGTIAFSVLCQLAWDVVWRVAGLGPANLLESWWYPLYVFVPTVLVPLGSMIVAASFVARALERGTESDSAPERPRTISAAWLFWTGLTLTVLGLVVSAYLQDWLTDLNAAGRTSLALDALNLVVIPLRMIILPLGLALLPAAVLVKKIESRSRAGVAALPHAG
ncbi:hypothetical protein E3O42_01510 [Cryobacterium adonitolivorans]|uniref:Uncharacterized protein n=1 Tax=Cryobacterium adonitolivorans TaxID=1259189 RepID=A0A4R8WCR5_9MICO|nr:hypothetical protein [Cryobacterium adonitolivorans]TFC07076.1 hypothetical protein E3O42_01510 [Cryobacterium adonitolivorans]